MSAQLRGALFRLVHGGALRNACIFALVRLLASSLGVFVISVLVTLLSASRKDVA